MNYSTSSLGKRFVQFILLAGAGLALSASPTNQLVIVYTATDGQLLSSAQNAERWKDFFILTGDHGWAAYYAGREAVYREQINDALRQVGLGP